MSESTQNYANHRRFVPLFHGFVFLSLLVNLGWSAYQLISMPNVDGAVRLLLALALIVLTFFVRVFPLKAQDRVIRLEMQLRMRELLPADLQPRIAEFTPAQLIALRFASDRELPGLAARVLKDNIQDQNAIKKLVTEWRADTLRV